MKRIQMLSYAAIAALALGIGGCAIDGEDGKNGIDGAAGATGADGETPYVSVPTRIIGAGALISFEELAAPVTDADKKAIQTSAHVTYTTDGQTDSIGFTKLMSVEDADNGEAFGLLKDYTDTPLQESDGSPFFCNGTAVEAQGSGLDHSSILQKDGKLFMVAQFECGIGAMYGFELEQDPTTGALSAKSGTLQYISQKEDFGGWVHCAGMTTPWESHLGSEEYEVDARQVEETMDPLTRLVASGNSVGYYNEVTKKYWHDENNDNMTEDNNPYFYGWIPEVQVDGSGATPLFDYTKHFSMGRAAWELAYVMPDRKTAYLSDDGTNVGFFMYVADTAEDLSAGTLYAAKWIQTSDVGAGAADLMWIRLGHATDTEIKTIVASKPTFSDIFETEAPVEGGCPTAGFSFVNNAGGVGYDECLKVKSGQEKAAAFLETRRYAAMMGATTEFRKEEGITYAPEHRVLYVAMSEVRKGMTDGKGDIDLKENKCGAVYGLDLYGSAETAYDSEQNVIGSAYVVKNMYGVIAGSPASYPDGSAYESYSCSVNGIANPDNISYLADHNLLAIGEDTSAHPNDFIWAFDIGSGDLTRFVSTPYGSETTSPFWYPDVNGWGYLTVTTQHPFGEVNSGDAEYGLVGSATAAEKQSSIGVVGPFDFIADGNGTR